MWDGSFQTIVSMLIIDLCSFFFKFYLSSILNTHLAPFKFAITNMCLVYFTLTWERYEESQQSV